METEIFNRTSMVFRAALTMAKNGSLMWDGPLAAARGAPERVHVEPIALDRIAALVVKGDAHRPVFAPKLNGEGFEWSLSGNTFLRIGFDAPEPDKIREMLAADKELGAAARAIGKPVEAAAADAASASTRPDPAGDAGSPAGGRKRGLGPSM